MIGEEAVVCLERRSIYSIQPINTIDRNEHKKKGAEDCARLHSDHDSRCDMSRDHNSVFGGKDGMCTLARSWFSVAP